MKPFLLVIMLASVAAFSMPTPSYAGVVVGVGVNVGGPGCGYYPPPPYAAYVGLGPSVYVGPGYYPWCSGYWHGGYYRAYYGRGYWGAHGGYWAGHGGYHGGGNYGGGGGYHGGGNYSGGGGYHH